MSSRPGPHDGGAPRSGALPPLFHQVIQGKSRHCDWPERQGQEKRFVVVAGNPVHAKRSASRASMDDGPFSFLFDPHGNRLHGSLAGRSPVPVLEVHVQAPEAPRTVIALI